MCSLTSSSRTSFTSWMMNHMSNGRATCVAGEGAAQPAGGRDRPERLAKLAVKGQAHERDEGPEDHVVRCRRRIASTRWTLGHPRFRTRSSSAQAMTISKQATMTMGVVDRLIA